MTAMKGISPIGWTQAVAAAVVFAAWTVTSFLCHECGKMFLQVSEKSLVVLSFANELGERPFSRFCLASVLTTIQCVSCLLLVQPVTDSKLFLRSRAVSLLIASHVLATLATNYSMAFIEAASTLAIKLTEPITMAVAHHLIFQTAVPLQTAISIPLIILGALVFTGQKVHDGSNSAGIALAFASNIILAARNVTLKKLQNGSSANSTIALRPYKQIVMTFLAQVTLVMGMYYLEEQNIIPRNCSLLAGLSLTSGIFHVAYSFISTNIVLKIMNVVSHSIANIFKRFLVVLLLCAVGNRQISARDILGLIVAVFGLLIYTYGKTQSEVRPVEQEGEKVSRPEPLRRKLWLGLGVLALISVTVVGSYGRSTLFEVSEPITDKMDNIYRESHGLNEIETPSTDFSHIEKAETNHEMREFLSWRLIDHPEDTDKRAKTLTRNKDVMEEAQRILVNILQDLLGKAKHVMLIEIATYENKGDPAIAVGEVLLLRRMNISIVFYCETGSCSSIASLSKALEINKKYAKDELVILMQGGGNLVGYTYNDLLRKKYISSFPDRRMVLFSQSIWLHSKNAGDLKMCSNIYSNHSNLVIFLRDRQSLEIAKANFKGVKLILAPDMAFCIGMVPRQMPPIYDIIWLRRDDHESSRYTLPAFPPNITVDVRDWYQWKSNQGQTMMEHSFLITAAGFQFLQRGRIVVTDRLHGHILSTLMNIPHVLIDNPPHFKLSSFDNSWTRSLSNTIRVSNGSLALEAAMELLTRYHNSLPSIGPKDMYVVSKNYQ